MPLAVQIDKDVPMTTRDGVTLRADVYRPDGRGRFPVLLSRLPYDKNLRRRPGDIDVFVDKTPGRKFGFDELMGSYHALCDAIPGIEISYATRAGLSKYIKNEVEQQAVRIF